MATRMRAMLREQRRQRDLASGGRAGRYARTQAWRQARSFVRRFWWGLILVPGLFVLAFLPVVLIFHGEARGAVLGASAVSGVWLDVVGVLVLTGVASKLMGVSGEAMTVDALRSLRRQGWRLVNGLKLRNQRDIDHVLIGPGGVLVVETKWSGEPWPLNRGGSRFMEISMKNAAEQASDNARDLADLLAATVPEVHITSIVVLWTGASESGSGWKTGRNGRTVLVHGSDLRGWLQTELPQTGLAAESIERVWAVLDAKVEHQDRADAEAGVVVEPTLTGLAKNWLVKPAVGFVVAAYALLALIRWGHDWRVTIVGTGVAVVVGLWATRVAPFRQVAFGWIGVSVGMALAEIGVLIAVAIR